MTRLNPMDLSFVTDNVAIKEERSPTSTVAIQLGSIGIDERSEPKVSLPSIDTQLQHLSDQYLELSRRSSASSICSSIPTTFSDDTVYSAASSPRAPKSEHSLRAQARERLNMVCAHVPSYQPYPTPHHSPVYKAKKSRRGIKNEHIPRLALSESPEERFKKNEKKVREKEARDVLHLCLSRLEHHEQGVNPNIANEARGGYGRGPWKALKSNNIVPNLDPNIPPLAHNKNDVLDTTLDVLEDHQEQFEIIIDILKAIGQEKIAAHLALCVQKSGSRSSKDLHTGLVSLRHALKPSP